MQQIYLNYCQMCGKKLFLNDNRSKYCLKCNFYYYSFPTACVVLLLYTDSGDYLFIERSKNPDKGKLDFPGSFIRVEETAEITCKRVAFEEISLSNLDLEYFGSSHDYYGNDKNIPIISLLFTSKIDDSTIKRISPKNDASRAIFLSKKQVNNSKLAYASMIGEIEKLENYILGKKASS